MSENPLTVSVIAPSIKPVKLQVTPPTVQTINLLFRVHPEFVTITNYDLVTKSGSVFTDKYDITKDIINNELTINVNYLPYTELTALEHAKHLARIYLSMSSHRQNADCSQSVVGWMIRNYGPSSSPPTSIHELDGIYPVKYVESSLPRPVKSIDISTFPLNTKEQVLGCLVKLSVKTAEKQDFIVYCSEKGWFVQNNHKSIYPTLHHLLCSISKFYSDNYSLIADKWCQLLSAERQPYTPLNNTKIFVEKIVDKSGQTVERGRLQLFANKIDTSSLSNMTLDDLIQDAKSDGASENVVNQLEMQYANKFVEAVSAIKRGSLVPYCGTSSFLFQDLFVSNIESVAELNNDRGSIDTAYRSICNEIQAYSTIVNGINDTFRIVRPMCADFFTSRYVAQTVIPGLITHRSSIVYGYSPGSNRTEFISDPTAAEILQEAAAHLGVASSQVKGSPKPIFSSAEATGVVSTDGHFYLSDYKRITPRDANYPDPVKYHGCIIRPEAITSFSHFTSLEKNSAELIKLGGDRDFAFHPNPAKQEKEPLTQEQYQKLEETRSKILENTEHPLFDINALTLDSSSKNTPQNIKEIAKFIIDTLIPKFVTEYAESSSFIVEGRNIVHEMHSRGINIRYLGRIHKLLGGNNKNKPLSTVNTYFALSVESEIISRSFKTLMRNEKADLETLLAKLSLLVGLTNDKQASSKLFAIICNIAQDKFETKPQTPQDSQRLFIVRSVLSAFGVSLLARSMDSNPLTVADVASISPVVKFPFTRNAKFTAAVDVATTVFTNGDLEQAFTLFNVALQISENAVDPFDEGIALCYFYLALIFDQKGDAESAFNSCVTSLIIQEKHSDQLSPEIIIRYSLLARYAKLTQKDSLAFAFADRAANLAKIVAPVHPWVAIEYSVAADLSLKINPEFGLKYAEEKIAICPETEEGKKQKALFYASMSKGALELHQHQKGLEYAEKALSLDPQNTDYKGVVDLIKNTIK